MKEYNEYELTYIVSLEKAEEIAAVKKIVAEIVEKNHGQIVKESDPQKRKLAWTIKGQKNGLYLVNRVTIAKKNTAELERQLRMQPEVLKHLFTSIKSLPDIKNLTEEERIAASPVKAEVKEAPFRPTVEPKEVKQEVKIEEKKKTEVKEESKLTKEVLEEVKTEKKDTPKEEKEKEDQEKESPKKEVAEKKEEKEKEETEVKANASLETEKEKEKKKEKPTKLKFEDLDKKIDDILKEDLI